MDRTPPRPDPVFFQETRPLLTKKDGLAQRGQRIRPPQRMRNVDRSYFRTKTCRPQPVSFTGNEASFNSPHYNARKSASYLQQCFHVDRQLGEGSFGVVYKVRCRWDNRWYAVKEAHHKFRGERDRQMRLQEVAKHERLPPHPHCVRFVKAWEEDYRLYIQTELCHCSLATYAEENHNIPEHVVWQYLVDLLLGLKHLHDHNLVHLDVKPENIFIAKEGFCKLGDFGLVLDLTLDDSTDPLEGDPCYLAPEIMEGNFTKAADVFSLGITTLELACDLELPGQGENWHVLRSGTLPDYIAQRLSPELRTMIEEMMQPNPNKRPTVDQLLERPEIKKVLRQRRVYVAWRRSVARIQDLVLLGLFWLHGLLQLAWTLPVSWFKALWGSPGLCEISPQQSLSDTDCFSDDEAFEDPSADNGLGLHLDSVSSIGSNGRRNSFGSDYSPKRSTPKPLLHRRDLRLHSTPTVLFSSPKRQTRSSSSISSGRPLYPVRPFNVSLGDFPVKTLFPANDGDSEEET